MGVCVKWVNVIPDIILDKPERPGEEENKVKYNKPFATEEEN